MKPRITLGEKLKDLRVKKKLILTDVEAATGISTSTLQRMEADADIRVGYQDIVTLAKFYNVSTDLLFGLTDNDEEHRVYEIDQLRLTDAALDVLKDGNLNNRLVSELLSHSDFQQLLNAIEVYVDKKLLPHMNTMNAVYKMAETSIKENYEVDGRDEVMAFLQNSVIDEDEFLRYRISERFNDIMKSLFDAHRKDALPPEQTEVINDMKELVNAYLTDSTSETENKHKAILFCKHIGLNATKLNDEEWRVLISVLERSEKYKRMNKRK